MTAADVRVFTNEADVADELAAFVVQTAKESIDQRGVFTIGFSGGSAAKYLTDNLPRLNTTDWNNWRVFFCDERHVASDDPDSTYGFFKRNLFDQVSIRQGCIFATNTNISVEEAAKDYTDKLKTVFGSDASFPEFDLLLLGMGPDGHTCSLFPGHPLVEENNSWVASITDSPKPPPQRVTMTFPVLLNARNAVFVACGEGKATMVKRVLEETETPPLPAARVQPHKGNLVWFLDQNAARLLKSS